MGYTPEMLDLIKRVEATRETRYSEEFPAMELDVRNKLVEDFHPDYKPEYKREIKIGVSKGIRIPSEVADTIEARPYILANPGEIDLENPDYVTDILVIGGGGAGCSAALLAQENGSKVILVTKLRLGDANTMMAEGGIQGADQPTDTPARHWVDVMGGGHFTNDPELVEVLTMDAPLVLRWLENMGVMFSRKDDGKGMYVLHGGGTSRKRMHSASDITGAEIMRTLKDEVLNHPKDIDVIEFSPAVELIMDDKGKCAGAVLYNFETQTYKVVKAKATIIATGGQGRLHIQGFSTTNHYGATADGLVLAYHLGVELVFLHSVQYHPTGAIFPEQVLGILITEKVRGLGAHVLNVDGEQFVYPREPRDVEASAIIRECTERGKGVPTPAARYGSWLDSPMIDKIHGAGTIKQRLAGKYRLFYRHGIDIAKVPILIYPTLHYQNGGGKININCDTIIPGLYMAGEVVGGIHGENRLMGNSLLGVAVFGRRAGIAAAEYVKSVEL